MTDTVVIEGIAGENVHSFLGIRYAKPPTAENRFRPPQDLARGEETTDATRFGHRNFQVGVLEDILGGLPMPGEQSEDCLFLNVYAPADMTGSKPVLVWIHGGAFTSGSANDYEATRLVADNDVVVVTINYRLGIFGFIDLTRFGPEYAGSANLGLQDQIAALRWVANNIAAFGGDPSNVTIWGQSAGGTSVSSLLAAPAAEGLFDKAMAFSGGESRNPPRDQIDVIKEYLGVETDAQCLEQLLAMPAQELSKLQTSIPFQVGPSIDGHVLTQPQSEAVKDGWASKIPIITGTTRDEGTFLGPAFMVDEQVGELVLLGLAADIGEDDGTAYLTYLSEILPDGGLAEHLDRAWFDFFRASGLRIAANASQHGAGGWVYNFEVETDHSLGITHFADVPFTFKWIEPDNPGLFVHPPTPENQDIAELWSDTLIEFARSGSPNGAGLPQWPQFAPDSFASMRISQDPALVENADGDLLEVYGVR
ncbi:MAG: carboxylesterase family protein [Myxococcota bacterium]